MPTNFEYDLTTNAGKVRLLIGDTDSTRPEYDNEEIDFFLDQANSSIYKAAELAARSLASKYSREATMQVGDLKIEYGKVADGYRLMASDFASRANINVTPKAGGISISGKDAQVQRSDRTTPSFARNQFDNQTSRTEERSNWNANGT